MTNPMKILSLMTILMLTACSTVQKTPMAEQQIRINDLNERALASAEKGYDADAQKLLQAALQLASSLDNKSGQILTLLNQSRLSRHNGKQQQAVQSLQQALTLSMGTSYYADVAQDKALQELATNHDDDATHWAEIARDSEQGNLIGRRLNLLARIALKKNDLIKATDLAEKALAANKDIGQELEQANSLRMLGVINTRTGQPEKAEELLQQALILDKLQAAPLKIAADLEALAELEALKNEPARQQNYLQRAKTVRKNSQKNQ